MRHVHSVRYRFSVFNFPGNYSIRVFKISSSSFAHKFPFDFARRCVARGPSLGARCLDLINNGVEISF